MPGDHWKLGKPCVLAQFLPGKVPRCGRGRKLAAPDENAGGIMRIRVEPESHAPFRVRGKAVEFYGSDAPRFTFVLREPFAKRGCVVLRNPDDGMLGGLREAGIVPGVALEL